MRELVHRQEQRFALIRSPRANANLAVFVHGYGGNYLTTWGDLSDWLHQHADGDAALKGWDFLFVGYSSGAVQSFLDIASVIREHWERASQGAAPFDKPYEKLALFGHSLGTLGIRQLLCSTCDYPTGSCYPLKAVVLFGSPLNGSPLARVARLMAIRRPKEILEGSFSISHALREGGPQIRMLANWHRSISAHAGLPSATVVMGTADRVVNRGDPADWPDDVLKDYEGFGHSDLVNAETTGPGWVKSPLYVHLREALT